MAKRRKARFEDEADAALEAALGDLAEADRHANERIPTLLRLPRHVLEFYDRVAGETGMSRNEVVSGSLRYLMENFTEAGDRTLQSPIGRFRRRVEMLVGELMKEIGAKAASVQLVDEFSKRRAARMANEKASDRIAE